MGHTYTTSAGGIGAAAAVGDGAPNMAGGGDNGASGAAGFEGSVGEVGGGNVPSAQPIVSEATTVTRAARRGESIDPARLSAG
jgi:hypothetical protein